jgi:Domain of unknown function (DUF4380)
MPLVEGGIGAAFISSGSARFAQMMHRQLIVLGCTLALVGACGDAAEPTALNTSGTGPAAGSPNSAGSASGGAGSSAGGSGGATSAGTANVGGSGGSNSAGTGGAVAGGSGGAGGGATGPVKPVLRDGKWAFDMGDVTLEVDPQKGGRITAFKLGTENLLTDATVNPTYFGSTLWISPEALLWMQPPPAPIDSDPYTAVANDTSVTLTGMPYTSAKLSASASKTITADPALGAFKIEYKVTNTAQAAVSLSPWEVTRVQPLGLTFFPTGPSLSLSAGATLPTGNMGGITWFDYDATAATANSKLYADGSEGWVAHVVHGLVFIKSFADLTADKIGPNEGDVELFTTKVPAVMDLPYIEIECQGAYGAVAPSASTSWTVTWFLRKLPAGIEASVGNSALAKFVRDTIAGK